MNLALRRSPPRGAQALLATVLAAACAAPPAPEELTAVLYAQQEAWNAGDLEAFVEHGYWRSEGLTFFSGGAVTRGFGPLLERYERRYLGGGAAMGELSFSELEPLVLSADSAVLRGRWRLVFADGEPAGGLFTLLLRKLGGRWLIVHDHTSSDGQP
ncbi:MAG: DUF4440 domain-containing protein [Planctomycetes bacterium]|jgi:ketosteroid isomerase-like protein|nr:DUF4440 domain-containing protein [Planctomycetota bacterium]MDP6408491.1 nuclear transport factor 2 family protein [Planctomycetota bacterium]